MRYLTGLSQAVGWAFRHGRVLALLFLPFPVVIAFGHARVLTGALYRASLTAAATVVVVAAISGAMAATGPGRAIASAAQQVAIWWQYRQQLRAEQVRAQQPPRRYGPATTPPEPAGHRPDTDRLFGCTLPGDHSDHDQCQLRFVTQPGGEGHR